MLYPIKEEEFEQVYPLLEMSFPLNEIRSFEAQKNLLRRKEYQILGYKQNSVIIGVVGIWDLGKFIFIEHFLVDPRLRSQGIGRKIINRIQESFQKTILLEVELPKETLAKRRIRFYERQGFTLSSFGYRQPGYRVGDMGPDLLLMSYPNPLMEENFIAYKQEIFNKVYGI